MKTQLRILSLVLGIFIVSMCGAYAQDLAEARSALQGTVERIERLYEGVEWSPETQKLLTEYYGTQGEIDLKGRIGDYSLSVRWSSGKLMRLSYFGEERPPASIPDEQAMETACANSADLLRQLEIVDLDNLKIVEVFPTPDDGIIHIHYYRHSEGIRFHSEKVVCMFDSRDLSRFLRYRDLRTDKQVIHPPTMLPDDELVKKSDEPIAGFLKQMYEGRQHSTFGGTPYTVHPYTLRTRSLMIVDPSDNYFPFVEQRSDLPLRVALVSEYGYGPPPGGLPTGGISGGIKIWIDAETGEVIGGDYAMAIQIPAMAAK